MPRLAGLQLLRAAAALLVLIGHVIAEAEHYFGLDLAGDAVPWTRGVDIFFVISGFIVTLSAHRFVGQPGAFLWRRMLRVVPLYYLFTSLMVLVLLVVPGGAKDTALDPGQILSSYGFFPYARGDGRIAPVLSLGWTLNYEVFFYLLFAAALALPRPFLSVSAALIGLGALGLWVPLANAQAVFWTNPIVIEFVFGIALGRIWLAGWHRPHAGLALLAVTGGFALLIALDATTLPRFIAAGGPAALIVAGGTVLCPRYALPGQIMGDASYALYLSHRFTLRAGTLVLLPLLPMTDGFAWAYVGVMCVLASAVAVVVYWWVERPMLAALSAPPRRGVAA
jgi:peptidoglycan/LPS O-acetylase OafA/YrhL